MTLFHLCSDELQRSGIHNSTFTKIGRRNDWNNSTYGNEWMNSNSNDMYSWNIKIDKMAGRIYVGVVSNLHHQQTNKDFVEKHSYCCGLYNGYLAIDGNAKGCPGHTCKTGDGVTLIIDFRKMEIQTLKNGNKSDKKIWCKIKGGIHIKYRLVLCIRDAGDRVMFTSNNDINDEQKKKHQDDVVAFVKKISILEIDNKKKTLENERLKKEIQSLKNTKQDANDKSMQRISNLEDDNTKKTVEIKRLKNTISTLQDERKEFEMTINELEEENKRLKLENINTDNYENWSADEIIYWIISLDPQIYGQYKDSLSKVLKEEEVNGECLEDVDVSDIKRWGIKNFKHSKQLLKEIKSLIRNKNQKVMNPMLNEGVNAPTAYI